MPNVMIIGFEPKRAEHIRSMVELLLSQMGEHHDACTTIVPAEARFHALLCDDDARGQKIAGRLNAPYLLVRNTKLARARKIAMGLHKELNLDVEYEKIAGFFVAKPKLTRQDLERILQIRFHVETRFSSNHKTGKLWLLTEAAVKTHARKAIKFQCDLAKFLLDEGIDLKEIHHHSVYLKANTNPARLTISSGRLINFEDFCNAIMSSVR